MDNINIVENNNDQLEKVLNKKSVFESNCVEFFKPIISYQPCVFIGYYISNFGRIYDDINHKFVDINEKGNVKLSCYPSFLEDQINCRFFNLDHLMLANFTNKIYLLKYYHSDYKIIHKDNNQNNHRLENLGIVLLNNYI